MRESVFAYRLLPTASACVGSAASSRHRRPGTGSPHRGFDLYRWLPRNRRSDFLDRWRGGGLRGAPGSRILCPGLEDREAGTIVWPNGADLDPDMLFEAAHRTSAKP